MEVDVGEGFAGSGAGDSRAGTDTVAFSDAGALVFCETFFSVSMEKELLLSHAVLIRNTSASEVNEKRLNIIETFP